MISISSSSRRNRYAFVLSACLLLGLSACQTPVGDTNPLYENARATRVSEAVDGLVVGHRLMAAGEYELALDAYERAAVAKGWNADVMSAMGSANLRLGRIREAENLLRAAVKEDDRFAAAWNNLGIVLVTQGHLREAENTFKLAFALTSGKSDEIKSNLIKTMEKIAENSYKSSQEREFELVRRGNGRFLLLKTPENEPDAEKQAE
ncbi:MAG: tetratricopeptide repeat protein [Pseudomonadota bacterium]